MNHLWLTNRIKHYAQTGNRARTGDDLEQLEIYHPDLVARLAQTVEDWQNERNHAVSLYLLGNIEMETDNG